MGDVVLIPTLPALLIFIKSLPSPPSITKLPFPLPELSPITNLEVCAADPPKNKVPPAAPAIRASPLT